MSTVQRIFWAHMLVAVAILAIGYALAGVIFAALVIVFLGATWFTAQQRGMAGLEGMILLIFIVAAGIGTWLGLPGWLLLIAVVSTLGAWDLDHFLQRLSVVERVAFDTGLGREHLRRLGIVEGISLLVGLVAISFRTAISFWWEALLILLAVIGIRVVIWFVRKQMEK